MSDQYEQLEKVDELRQRTGLDFGPAKSLLEETGWNLLEALALYETRIDGEKNQFLNRLKQVLEQSNNTRVLVKSKESTVAEFPMTVGVLGAVLAPKLALLGGAACLLSKCSLQLKQSEGAGGEESPETPE